jgi:hypothetical protein
VSNILEYGGGGMESASEVFGLDEAYQEEESGNAERFWF